MSRTILRYGYYTALLLGNKYKINTYNIKIRIIPNTRQSWLYYATLRFALFNTISYAAQHRTRVDSAAPGDANYPLPQNDKETTGPP